MGGVLFFYKKMLFSTTMIGVGIFTLGGEFYENENTPQLWDRGFCRNSSLQAVCDTPMYYGLCVLIKDIGRRLPLQLQCSNPGQQGYVSQSVRGNYKTRFWGGQHLTAVKGKVGNCEVDPTSYLFYEIISVVSTVLLYHMYGGWFADGWLDQGCWYLWSSA